MHDAAVLIVEDDANLRGALSDTLASGRYPVLSAGSGAEALSILGRERVGLVVSDIQMEPMSGHQLLSEIRRQHPAMPAVLMTAYGTIENAVDVMRDGASDYLVKPFAADELIAVVDRYMHADVADSQPIAGDAKTIELLRIAERVARSDATVTISGESGCGKEVFARFIHDRSLRRDKPFVAINCAAIPENMLEAVLFGYEKGAFTGATSAHPGKFEQAEGGTLLLDEISEMDLSLQAKLLRVIQEREVERLAGRTTIALDVRVLATTNRNLRQCVSDGAFREDLYYRLNVFPLRIPPLRERRGDILPLTELAIARHHNTSGPRPILAECAVERLLSHDWPGNVRELDNLVQRSLIMLGGATVRAADLAFEECDAAPQVAATPAAASLQDEVKQHEYERIRSALGAHHGKRSAAAKALGISPRTLRYKLARMRDEGVDADTVQSSTLYG
ncbi:sigma-54-dependent transcriptional regulator [Woeseia oceani]|uniref:Sigma-54-dependent Fis family transcriptional regulator n=1 Tax=Woeseia oceani TaxID=1548547 RepID=A0A193LF86_9GAMM|nr:sigma-54 dependent transcriptional regulator [Woeseia oceani]ANO51044.1 sigma-54-dependent Fis family transcriptional regulator [Woeseia oceani]